MSTEKLHDAVVRHQENQSIILNIAHELHGKTLQWLGRVDDVQWKTIQDLQKIAQILIDSNYMVRFNGKVYSVDKVKIEE